jgi:hypothetical protein
MFVTAALAACRGVVRWAALALVLNAVVTGAQEEDALGLLGFKWL